MPGRPIDTKWAPFLFIAGQLLLMAMVLAALVSYEDFSLWDNSLSDLGMGDTAPLFNGGLVLGGILSVVFYGSLWVSVWKHMGLAAKAGAVMQPLSMLFMILVGIFTESFGRFHFYIACCFFGLLVVGTMLLGISMVLEPAERVRGFFGVVIAALGLASWFLPRGDGLALPEILSCLPFFLWMCAIALTRWREIQADGGRPGGKGAGPEEE